MQRGSCEGGTVLLLSCFASLCEAGRLVVVYCEVDVGLLCRALMAPRQQQTS